MQCYNEKNQHIGNLKVLRRFTHLDTESVVRWCPECGAVVIDREVDDRLMGSVVDMKFPEITKNRLKRPRGPKHILKD
jgi:hypothetical protein